MPTATKKPAKEKSAVRIVPLGDRVVLKRADSESKTLEIEDSSRARGNDRDEWPSIKRRERSPHLTR